ncbi:MAG: serine hydrolase [Gemmatimonadaceae bacterium]
MSRLQSLFLVALFPLPAVAQVAPSLGTLRSRIVERVGQSPGATVGIYIRNLGDGKEISLNADTSFHAASTMKVPVMIEYFRAVDEGRISPSATTTLQNSFNSIVDGSNFTLDAGDDSDSSLYARVGQEVGVRELVERMITRSSNLATNSVIALVNAHKADATARALGARNMHVLRGVEDNKAFRAGRNNTTTAHDLGMLFLAIAEGRAASRGASQTMLDILAHQEFNEEIPAGLPPGTRVAHKTGWITGTLHDAALVFPPGRAPFVLVVLTGGIADEKVARTLIQDVARLTWEALVPSPQRTFR